MNYYKNNRFFLQQKNGRPLLAPSFTVTALADASPHLQFGPTPTAAPLLLL